MECSSSGLEELKRKFAGKSSRDSSNSGCLDGCKCGIEISLPNLMQPIRFNLTFEGRKEIHLQAKSLWRIGWLVQFTKVSNNQFKFISDKTCDDGSEGVCVGDS